jgi:hypothetical protein
MTERAVYRRPCELRERFTPPPGFTYPEISDGMFVMTMSPCRRHQVTVVDVRDQLAPQVPDGVGVFKAADTGSEVLGKLRIPDLVVTTGEAAMPLLAVEVVSPSNPGIDYEDKSRDYPAMGIPHYLIVDPCDGTWTYQWEVGTWRGFPEYENRLHLPYGNTVTIAGEWKVATGGLPLYSAHGHDARARVRHRRVVGRLGRACRRRSDQGGNGYDGGAESSDVTRGHTYLATTVTATTTATTAMD